MFSPGLRISKQFKPRRTRCCASAGSFRSHSGRGTTPNIAPPSSAIVPSETISSSNEPRRIRSVASSQWSVASEQNQSRREGQLTTDHWPLTTALLLLARHRRVAGGQLRIFRRLDGHVEVFGHRDVDALGDLFDLRVDLVFLQLADDLLARLRVGRPGTALVLFELDDVVAELRLDKVADLAGLHAERRLLEFGDETAALEGVFAALVLRGGIVRVLL